MKNKAHNKVQNKQESVKIENKGISKNGYKVILAGIFVVIVGFLVLTKTDPFGQNLASKVSPFLILGGYAIIGLGLIWPDPVVPPAKS